MTSPLWPSTIREINALPENDKQGIYKTLLPEWLYTKYGMQHNALQRAVDDAPIVTFRALDGSRAMEIIVKRRVTDIDPMLYLNMTDTFNGQLLVLLVVINDPESPRFNTDVDENGNRTQFGTLSRNIPAELTAMNAGLAPGQIRKGLRVFRETVPIFENFVTKMGRDIFFIEPLSYHNAIIFERYGFNYLRGHKDMVEINTGFLEGGEIFTKLTPENPFRQLDAAQTIRKRSWAIHDGILGHSFTGFQMYKVVGKHAGINTFPAGHW